MNSSPGSVTLGSRPRLQAGKELLQEGVELGSGTDVGLGQERVQGLTLAPRLRMGGDQPLRLVEGLLLTLGADEDVPLRRPMVVVVPGDRISTQRSQ